MLLKKIYLFIVCSLTLSACGIYSFTGASIAPDVKTINIKYFPNYAPLIQPTLSQSFTEALKDKFLTQTTLTQVNSNGDLTLEGSITDYNTKPISIQSGDQAAQNRLTIKVKVKYVNKKDAKFDFEQEFSSYSDYSSSQPLSSVEAELIRLLNSQLVTDIFNKSIANW